MLRTFDQHRKRRLQSLSGGWKFAVDRNNVGVKEGWQSSMPCGETVMVPSVWNTQPGLLEYEGVAWYQRDFYTDGGCLRFVFGGVMTDARVYLDGKEIGSHYGGFCQFEIIVRDVAEGAHRLTVRVDNSFDEKSIPQAAVDWYHYGGITRGVYVEMLRGVSVLSARLEYRLSEDLKTAFARVALEVYNADNSDLVDDVTVSVAGAEFKLKAELKSKESKELFTKEQKITNFELWSAENANLYSMEISTSTDDLIDRVGFRRVEVKGGKVLLNNKPIVFKGVNRHEEHPDFGFAFPEALMKRDIELALDMGCNAIRGAHYPNHPAFLDLLDEMGVYFWSEIPIWGGGFSAEALNDPAVLSRGEEMHLEMLKHYYNHPSIIFWGMHNEILTDSEAGIAMSKSYYELLCDKGGNRIVTYASNRGLRDICYEYCDVISINQYTGWYEGDKNAWGDFIGRLHEYVDGIGYDDKPIIISEFGAAAVYGHRTFETFRWSEDYQAELISSVLRLLLNDDKIAGAFIWQLFDIRTSTEAGISRARGYNNKGLLNEYRNPKQAYFEVKKIFAEK